MMPSLPMQMSNESNEVDERLTNTSATTIGSRLAISCSGHDGGGANGRHRKRRLGEGAD